MIVFDSNKPQADKNIFIYGHLDKQPPMEGKWDEGLGPFDPVVKDDKLYGRGSSDDGYAFFAYTLIVKALQKFDLPHHRLVFIFETDEESGSKDIVYYLEKEKDFIKTPDVVICSDSGTIDYERICFTTSLRGACNFTVSTTTNKKNRDALMFGNVGVDSFRIMRKAV